MVTEIEGKLKDDGLDSNQYLSEYQDEVLITSEKKLLEIIRSEFKFIEAQKKILQDGHSVTNFYYVDIQERLMMISWLFIII